MNQESLQELCAQLLRQIETERARIDDLVAWSESFEGEVLTRAEELAQRERATRRDWQDTEEALRNHEYDRRYHPNA